MKKFKLFALLIAIVMIATMGLTACGDDGECNHTWTEATCKAPKTCTKCNETEGEKTTSHVFDFDAKCTVCGLQDRYTYNTYASSFPKNWNPHSYETADEGDIMGFFTSSFFEFDYKFDEDGEIVEGEFTVVPVLAADFPEDVTAQFAGEWGIPATETEGFAYKITLREGITWNDADKTPIKAADFIYSMEEQLNPKFMHYRADSYYNSTTVLAGAEGYNKQGTVAMRSVASFAGLTETADWLLEEYLEGTFADAPAFINWNYSFGARIIFTPGNPGNGWYNEDGDAWNTAAAEDKVVDSGATIADLHWLFQNLSGGSYYKYFRDEVFIEYAYPEMTFDKVGLLPVEDDDYSFYFIMSKPFIVNESNYGWAYDFGSSWLVKEDLYEELKNAPTEEGELWTSTYGTSVATTASYGPYMLEDFQQDKEYTLVKNPNWIGYTLPSNEGKYQTTHYYCEYVKEWSTAWAMFQRGEIDAIGITVDIANEYKGSERAYFNPRDYVSTMQIQSNLELLKNEEDELNADNPGKYDKEILSIVEFRKALSLAYDRVDFTAKTTTASQVGFGLFGPAHYYDVENGKVYRNSDVAKQVICEVYAVDIEEYASLDEAYAAVTGYDLEEARTLIGIAVTKAVDAGFITLDGSGKVVEVIRMVWGSSADNAEMRRSYDYIKPKWEELMVGTPLEGKLDVTFDGNAGDYFADWFQEGRYDILMAGWQGAAWNPFYLIMAYLSDSYKYALAYDETEIIEVTVDGFDFDPATEGVQDTKEMSIWDWYLSINGGSTIANITEVDHKLIVLAALEKDVLDEYVSVPTAYSYTAALRGYKYEAFGDKYHVFMGWGGIRYYTYNYTDSEWHAWVAAQVTDNIAGVIDYKK